MTKKEKARISQRFTGEYSMNFGEKLKSIRVEKDISLRKLAEKLGVSAPYLSDVERGQRKPLSGEYIDRVAEVLNLTPEERQSLFDAAAAVRGDVVASDVILYAGEVKNVSAALRKARELNLGDEEWLQIIEDMEKRKTK